MAQISTTLYGTIATNYANAREKMTEVDDYLLTALEAVVDITSGIPSGTEIELALLDECYSSYLATQNMMASTSSLFVTIRALNDYIITNTTAANRTIADNLGLDYLTYWVNTTMNPYWSCVPFYWEELCASAGYNTSGWDVCS